MTEQDPDFAAKEIQEKYNDIDSRQQSISDQQRLLTQRAALLERRVLDHFNNFLKNSINPALTKGRIRPAEKAQYESGVTGRKRGYVITTGPVEYPGGIVSDDPFEEHSTAWNECKKYEKNHPWVSHIQFGFSSAQ